MKKILLATTIIASLSALSVHAADNDLTAGTAFIGTGKVSKTACPLLDLAGEDARVTLSLSKNVNGVFNCDETKSIISFATCHEGGSRQESMTTDTPPVAFTDYKGYFASSRGGSIGASPLGGKCSDTTVASFLTKEVAKITD